MEIRFSNGFKLVLGFSHFRRYTPTVPDATMCTANLYHEAREVDKDLLIRSTCGIAHCSSKDQFNKAKGRKVALTHALSHLPLLKNERKVVWEEYFKSNKKQ